MELGTRCGVQLLLEGLFGTSEDCERFGSEPHRDMEAHQGSEELLRGGCSVERFFEHSERIVSSARARATPGELNKRAPWQQVASSGSLGFGPEMETTLTVSLHPLGGIETTIVTTTLTGLNTAESATLSPDLNDTDMTDTGIAGYVWHMTDTSSTARFSPGARIDGSAF